MSEMEMDVYYLQGVFLLSIAGGESEQRQTFLDVPLRSHARWGNGGTWLVTWYSVVLPNPRANRGSINRPPQQDIACQLAFIGIMTMDDILMNGSGIELFLGSVCKCWCRFITALKGPEEELARDFLSRIAAKVVPIMKKHGMDVMSLEEFEPNREFVGRYSLSVVCLCRLLPA